MALFKYQALSKEGKKIQGVLDAPSQEIVRDQLIKSGFYPIEIAPSTEEQVSLFQKIRRIFTFGVSNKEKILFTKQFAVLLKSGVPLLQSLQLLTEQFTGRLHNILVTVKDSIKEGQSLAQGLAKYPNTFDNIYVQLVRAGEATGKLEIILERLTEYMERRQMIVKRVKGALTYPLIQLVVVILVVIGLLTFVLPNLAQTFSSQGAQLPWSTAFLMGISDFLLTYYYLIIGFFILFYFAFRYWKKTPSGGRMLDTIKLKLPIVGFFSRMGAVAQFSRTLGMLTESGVNLSEALDIVVNIIDNKVLKEALNEARDNIIKQGKIAEYLKQTNMFPPIAIYLINTGEQSGQLGFMLLTVAKNYEDELSEYAETLSSLLEPIMLIVMAVVVGFIVLSVVQPMLNQTALINM